MLEIFILITLTKKNASIAGSKGFSGGLFGAMTVGLWVLLELMTAFVGFLTLDVDSYVIAFMAFIGGVTGGLISYAIVKLLPTQPSALGNTYSASRNASIYTATAIPSTVVARDPETTYCRACGATVTLPARFCDTCGAKIENNF